MRICANRTSSTGEDNLCSRALYLRPEEPSAIGQHRQPARIAPPIEVLLIDDDPDILSLLQDAPCLEHDFIATATTDKLIEIVRKGGTGKTGIDLFNRQGMLFLDGEVRIKQIQLLLRVKANGVDALPFAPGRGSGVWDRQGNSLYLLPGRLRPRPAPSLPEPETRANH